MFSFRYIYYSFILLFIFSACINETTNTGNDIINVRISSNPDRLNPILTVNPVARQINNQMFLPLADFDPVTMEFSPVLATAVSEGEKISSDDIPQGMRFDYEIRPEAKWDNGSDITGNDYLFTLKIVKNPAVNAASWRGYLKDITKVDIDENDPKKFSVYLNGEYMLAREVVSTFELFPEHLYDPEGILKDIGLEILNNQDSVNALVERDTRLQDFAEQFQSNKFSRDIVEGSGPYKLGIWEADQYVQLVRKDNWWGDALEGTSLENEPAQIIYRIIPDDQTAVNLIRSNEIDIMSGIPAAIFDDLKQDSVISENYYFYTPSLLRYYYLGLNNRIPEFQDEDVRRAFAHMVDVDQIIENLEKGYGRRTVGYVNPSTPYYNKELALIEYDIEKAKSILTDEGWVDSDANGILDKTMNGSKVEMDLDIVVSGSQLGQQIALLFQQSAKEAGININIDTRDQAGILNALNTREFDIIALAAGQAISAPDPYQVWHTDNDKPGAGNRFGFGNTDSDSIINAIRTELDPEKRDELYKRFQEILYDEQPVIFLYNPQERIMVNKSYEGIISTKRPGYFPASFKRIGK